MPYLGHISGRGLHNYLYYLPAGKSLIKTKPQLARTKIDVRKKALVKYHKSDFSRALCRSGLNTWKAVSSTYYPFNLADNGQKVDRQYRMLIR